MYFRKLSLKEKRCLGKKGEVGKKMNQQLNTQLFFKTLCLPAWKTLMPFRLDTVMALSMCGKAAVSIHSLTCALNVKVIWKTPIESLLTVSNGCNCWTVIFSTRPNDFNKSCLWLISLSNPNSTTFSGCSTPGQCENVGLNEGQAVLMVPQKGFALLMRTCLHRGNVMNCNYGKITTCV